MHRQLNDSEEMLRRLIYVCYLCGWIATIALAVLGLVQKNLTLLLLCGGCALCSVMIKQYGREHLHFQRLADSFPFGSEEDELPDTLRCQLENIFSSFQQENWQNRLELRRELTELIKKNPELLQIYPQEIAAVSPNLAPPAHSD